MAISEIINSLANQALSATVSLQDSAYHVKIGDQEIELGVRDSNDPDTSRPNPIEIRYTQEFKIVIHETVGQKPLTQCTIPDGLWEIMIKFVTLKGTDGGLSETLTRIKGFRLAPGSFIQLYSRKGSAATSKRRRSSKARRQGITIIRWS